MPFCPKCEEEYRDGFEACADCNVALVDTLVVPEAVDDAEEKYAEAMFDEAEMEHAHFCPSCHNEFVSSPTTCEPCGQMAVTSLERKEYESLLGASPIEAARKFRKAERPPGLARVADAASPADAGWIVQTLESMGVSATIGNDALDEDMADLGRVGVYAPEAEADAAQLLLEGDEAEEEATAGDYVSLLRSAQSYGTIAKYRHAMDLLRRAIQMEPAGVDGLMILGGILGVIGHTDRAAEAFEAVMDDPDRPEAAYQFAVYSLITDAGEVGFKSSSAGRAIEALDSFTRARPRSIAGLKLLFEASVVRGEMEAARGAYAQIQNVNRAVAEAPGRMAELAARLS